MAVSRRLRFEILRRDNYTCRYCGASAPDVVVEVDHVLATALGGSDEPSNLVTACDDCNSGKSSIAPDSPIVDDVEKDAIRWAKAVEKAAQFREWEREVTDGIIDDWDETWSNWTSTRDNSVVPRDADWRESVKNFVAQGLTLDELENLVDVTMRSRATFEKKWKFFCGCCWKSIADLQETARQLIESGEA